MKGRDKMTKNLVIVESPSKSKTIEKYLGTNYKVVSYYQIDTNVSF